MNVCGVLRGPLAAWAHAMPQSARRPAAGQDVVKEPKSSADEIDCHVQDEFEICQKLGRGAYGVVWKCVEKSSGAVVALKKIFDAFQNATDAQRTYREIVLLQELRGFEHIVQLRRVLGCSNDRDIYLVFDFLDTDLHNVIRASVLNELHKQAILYQLLKCLKMLHSAGLVHRDLKPSNILIDSKCRIKLADFGLARSMGEGGVAVNNGKDGMMTDYVATRWYRAPEILLGSSRYTLGVDMWSTGCIFGELISGRPAFPGNSTMNQLDRILEMTDKPSREDIAAMKSPYAATMLEALPLTPPRPLHEIYPIAALETLHLLGGLLQFNPANRLSAAKALEHPYMSVFHDPDTEPVAERLVTTPIDDNLKLSVAEYRQRLYTNIGS